MKPLLPNDPRDESLDELIAAALHGELTPAERTQFESRLQTDPAANAAYQEALLMHDLLEKTHQSAQPDPAFEQRMVSGVRRKIEHEQNRETAWESVVVLWKSSTQFLRRRHVWEYGLACFLVFGVAVTALIRSGNQVKGVFTTISSELAYAGSSGGTPPSGATFLASLSQNQHQKDSQDRLTKLEDSAQPLNRNGYGAVARQSLQMADADKAKTDTFSPDRVMQMAQAQNAQQAVTDMPAPVAAPAATRSMGDYLEPATTTVPQGGTIRGKGFVPPTSSAAEPADSSTVAADSSPSVTTQSGQQASVDKVTEFANSATPAAPAAVDTRKLIRNAQLELEVKSFQEAMDKITAMTRAAGGYVDTSNSQKGGNGKLQGTVVVKVLPQNLDDFLLKLRDLGELSNQSVSTDDVTKDYFDTQARLDNSRRMETQLQDLLKHQNSKVSDLLQVERELGRVRGDIEQMQGQLKLYDFQVQYATVTIAMREKDLNQAAAYLLREQDEFSLFATEVEGTFQKARQTADSFKAQILAANLNHNSGTDVSAELTVMVAPDQIEAFLTQIRGLGRVANFTRQTQRVAKDGGDSTQPADQTLTEKDKVQVHLVIRSDDESRKQVALTVVAKAVDDALDQAKTAALAQAGTEILSSSLNKTPEGQTTAQLSVRVPGQSYHALLDAFRGLGRTSSFSLQRDDNSGPGANGDDAPVIVSLALTDDDAPLQETEMSVRADEVNDQAQQLKKDAAAAGVEIKASSFAHQPDGTEIAQMTFRLPMSKYSAFIETLQKLGKVESLTVSRQDRPDQTITDDTAPAEISLMLHNQRDIVTADNGLWATLRQTFGEGAGALFASVRMIGVIVAFLAPWVFVLLLAAWVARRIYVRRKK